MTTRRAILAACAMLLPLGFAAGFFLNSAGSPVSQHLQAQSFDDEIDVEQRAELYAALERDVAAWEEHGNLLKRVVKLVSPTVVHIEAEKVGAPTRSYNRARTIEEAGSGVIFQGGNQKFYVLTNRHVIKNAALDRIKINLADGRQVNPTNVWMDPDTDIAVMAVAGAGMVPARLGNSDTVDIGDFVLAVGSPFGLSRSVTYGIISAKGRRDLQLGDDEVRFQDFLQTDAAINPGNSGGPLLNMRGEVIGINTAIASSSGGNEGIGFSIPINMVMVVARQLVDRGSVSRAFLGVNLGKFSPAMAIEIGLPRMRGARITGITPKSPAEAAKLRVGDVILEFGGIDIEDDTHLINIVSLTEVNREVPVVIFRDRQKVNINVTVGDRSAFESQSYAEPADEQKPLDLGSNEMEAWDIAELGLTVVDLNPEIAEKMQLSATLSGLVVTEVRPEGPTDGRIDRGEIIDQIDQKPIRRIIDLEHVMSRMDWQQGIRMHVMPGSSDRKVPRTVFIKPEPARAH